VQLKLSDRVDGAKPHTPTFEAFDLYLRGVHAMPSDLNRAEELLQQSIQSDRAYARPYVALSRVYELTELYGTRPGADSIGQAQRALMTALDLDPSSAEAHASLAGLLARRDFQWEMAESEARRALQLDPNSSSAHFELSQNVLAPQERWNEAMAEDRRARELDPMSPTLAAGHAWLLHLQRQDAESIAAFRAVAADNDDQLTISGLALVLLQHGDIEAALEVINHAGAGGRSPMLLAFRGYAFGRAGRRAEAAQALRELTAFAPGRPVEPSNLFLIHSGLGDRDRALHDLAEARARHHSSLIFLRTDAVFDPVRSDPRFDALLKSVGLSDEDLAKRRAQR
jgi:tetratricopeptide (TPR) repeat protein